MSLIILDSSAVEHPAVNRRVVGSSPTRGVVLYRGIVQLVERRSPKPNVVGSSPATPVYNKIKSLLGFDMNYKCAVA